MSMIFKTQVCISSHEELTQLLLFQKCNSFCLTTNFLHKHRPSEYILLLPNPGQSFGLFCQSGFEPGITGWQAHWTMVAPGRLDVCYFCVRQGLIRSWPLPGYQSSSSFFLNLLSQSPNLLQNNPEISQNIFFGIFCFAQSGTETLPRKHFLFLTSLQLSRESVLS